MSPLDRWECLCQAFKISPGYLSVYVFGSPMRMFFFSGFWYPQYIFWFMFLVAQIHCLSPCSSVIIMNGCRVHNILYDIEYIIILSSFWRPCNQFLSCVAFFLASASALLTFPVLCSVVGSSSWKSLCSCSVWSGIAPHRAYRFGRQGLSRPICRCGPRLHLTRNLIIEVGGKGCDVSVTLPLVARVAFLVRTFLRFHFFWILTKVSLTAKWICDRGNQEWDRKKVREGGQDSRLLENNDAKRISA